MRPAMPSVFRMNTRQLAAFVRRAVWKAVAVHTQAANPVARMVDGRVQTLKIASWTSSESQCLEFIAAAPVKQPRRSSKA